MFEDKGQSVYFPLSNGQCAEVWVDMAVSQGGVYKLEKFKLIEGTIPEAHKKQIEKSFYEAAFESAVTLPSFVKYTIDSTAFNHNDELERHLFPLILALRIKNKEIKPSCKGKVYALGYSPDWSMGRIKAYSNDTMQQGLQWLKQNTTADDVIFLPANHNDDYYLDESEFNAKIITLFSISDLSGKPIKEEHIQRACVLFPTVDKTQTQQYSEIGKVTITITANAASNNNSFLYCTAQANQRHDEIESILKMVRNDEQSSFKTLVDIQGNFDGGSYQLALVMADLISRGKCFKPTGKLYATGTGESKQDGSTEWLKGKVCPVEYIPNKLKLILTEIKSGDRVLLPKTNYQNIPLEEDWDVKPLLAKIRQKGATVACIETVGI